MHYQPSKGQSIFAGVVGVAFCLIGLFVVIPTFGPFGIFWTAIAGLINAYSFAMAAGKVKMGSYVIEEDGKSTGRQEGKSAEERLTELQNLYDRRLISTEEYEAKRREILEEL